MLSYRHHHHAGNFADVLKHAVLCACLEHLLKKPAPVHYLDTHAGAGRYRLQRAAPDAPAEIDTGALRLLDAADAPPVLAPYLAQLAAARRGASLDHYPGSPLLAARLLRADDRLALWELHPEDHRRLARLFRGDRRVQVHRADGPEAMPALLPTPGRRALVLIDPPYEHQAEYRAVEHALLAGLARMPSAVALAWYPLMAAQPARAMVARLGRKLTAPTLVVEFEQWRTGDAPGMGGCGLLVVNPPWTLADGLEHALPWLVRTLGAHGAGQRQLVAERPAANRR